MILDQGTVKFLIAAAEKCIIKNVVERDEAGIIVPVQADNALENRGANKILRMLRSYENTDNGSK